MKRDDSPQLAFPLPPRSRKGLARLGAWLVAGAVGCVGGEQAWKAPEAPTTPQKPDEVTSEECSAGLAPAEDGVIDDFEDGDNRGAQEGGRGGYWYTAKDSLGSEFEIPAAGFETSEGGTEGSMSAAHVKGVTSDKQDDQAWGVEIGMGFLPDNAMYDASKYSGLTLKAKLGSADAGKKVRVSLADVNTHPDGGVCKACYNHFHKELQLTPEWQEYTIAFSDMQQRPYWGDPRPDGLTPAKLVNLNFQMGGGQPFDIWLDDIKFVACKK